MIQSHLKALVLLKSIKKTAYLSMKADLEWTKNENKHLDWNRKELRLSEKEMDQR
jgi:hypothetical protein